MRDTNILFVCPFCGGEHSVKVALEDFVKWQCGELVQTAFPYLNATEREQVISGMCPDCQKNIFGEEEDADEYTGEADYDEAMAESLASTGQWW
jgi:hypothetical protein